MSFDNQYLTYSEYISLGGEQIGETPFNLLEFEARKQINLRTQNRLINEESIPLDVKICMFHLINEIDKYASAIKEASNVVNESIDGYSIQYVTASQINEIISSKNVALQDIMMSDLYNVIINNEHIIYNGVE